MATMQRLSVNLWFDKNAEDAVDFYMTIFKNAKKLRTLHYGKEGYEVHKMADGTIMNIEFELDGQKIVALNGGPTIKFNEAVSLVVNCGNQEEVDYYWEKLSAGGDKKSQQCGWLKDKFGVSWQVIPVILPNLLEDEEKKTSRPVLKAMMEMKKIDINKLEKAAKQ